MLRTCPWCAQHNTTQRNTTQHLWSHVHAQQTNPTDPHPSTNEFSSHPSCPQAQLPHLLPEDSPYVFLVPLPSRQLLLQAPRRPQPLLGQVPDPLLHEAQGLLARANELQQAGQVPPESCLGKEQTLHGECRESSCQRSPWAAPRPGGGLPISAEGSESFLLPWRGHSSSTSCPKSQTDPTAPRASHESPDSSAGERHGCAGVGPEEATKMIRGMKHFCCGDTLRELGVLSLDKRRLQRDLLAAFQYL